MIVKYKDFVNEQKTNTITLYHGTCLNNANELVKNGWKPNIYGSGSNMGDANYLYLSSDPDDALWFANEKGCQTIIELKNIPLDFLIPDPEDEAGFTMLELLQRINNTNYPAKFALYKELPSEFFKIIN